MVHFYFIEIMYRKSSHRAEKGEQEKTALWEIRPMRGIEKFYKYFEIRGWRPLFNSNSALYSIKKKLEVIFLKNHLYILHFNSILFFKNRTIERTYSTMRGISIFQKPHYREFRTMRGRPMRGLPVVSISTSRMLFLLLWAILTVCF